MRDVIGLSKMKKVLDVRGEECPEPVIKVARALEATEEGDTIFVLTDNYECVKYIKELVNIANIGELEIKERNNHYELMVRVRQLQ